MGPVMFLGKCLVAGVRDSSLSWLGWMGGEAERPAAASGRFVGQPTSDQSKSIQMTMFPSSVKEEKRFLGSFCEEFNANLDFS